MHVGRLQDTRTTDSAAMSVAAFGGQPWHATHDVLEAVLRRDYAGQAAVITSFGAESAVLLHLVAAIDPAAPVIFLQTGKLFAETLDYRDKLTSLLGLRDVRSITPDPRAIAAADPAGTLWQTDPDLCCWHRKTEPLDEATLGFAALITGRKRFQGGMRAALTVIEPDADGRVKVNPLAHWTAEHLRAYMAAHGLPPHELTAAGYASIGCAPCTRPTRPGEAPRAGRWAGRGKTECGIHLPRPVAA